MVYQFNEIPLSHIKQWTIDRYNSIDESQTNRVKEARQKIAHSVWFPLYKILENKLICSEKKNQ